MLPLHLESITDADTQSVFVLTDLLTTSRIDKVRLLTLVSRLTLVVTVQVEHCP